MHVVGLKTVQWVRVSWGSRGALPPSKYVCWEGIEAKRGRLSPNALLLGNSMTITSWKFRNVIVRMSVVISKVPRLEKLSMQRKKSMMIFWPFSVPVTEQKNMNRNRTVSNATLARRHRSV